MLEETFDVALLEEVVEEVEEVEPSDDILSSSVQISPGNITSRRLWKLTIESKFAVFKLRSTIAFEETYMEFT